MEQNDHKKRILILRRIILLTVALAILVPVMLCIIIAARYDRAMDALDKSREELMKNELVPFKAAIDDGVDMIMTAHILYPQVDSSTIRSELEGLDTEKVDSGSTDAEKYITTKEELKNIRSLTIKKD